MAAPTLALSSVSTRSVGNQKQGTATLTLTSASSDTYTNGGVTMPTGWKNTLGCPNSISFHCLSGPLMGSTPEVGYLAHIDVTNGKLILFGGQADSTTEALIELPTSEVIATGTYSCKIMVQGN
ncbi:hypothetical protein KKF61_09285 [Patescibacteria group bacterium]|nr:hypothetical protein [Patescibacteria group bacterium]